MVLATLGALAGQYAMSKVEANSANVAAKKASKNAFLQNLWAQDYMFNKQKEWEKERATHAHQWEMKDLKNAGLNPALTAMGGQGASTSGISPGGAMATPSATKGINLGKLLNYTNSAKQNAQRDRELDQQFQQIQSNITKQDAETLNIIKEGKWIDPKHMKDIEEAESRIINNASQSAKNTAEIAKIKEETENIKGGIVSKVTGTNPNLLQGAVGALSLVGGAGTAGLGLKILSKVKSAKQAKEFGKFLNIIGK